MVCPWLAAVGSEGGRGAPHSKEGSGPKYKETSPTTWNWVSGMCRWAPTGSMPGSPPVVGKPEVVGVAVGIIGLPVAHAEEED